MRWLFAKKSEFSAENPFSITTPSPTKQRRSIDPVSTVAEQATTKSLAVTPDPILEGDSNVLFNVPLQSDAAPSIEAPSPTETFSSDSVLTTELPRPIAPRDAVRLSAYRAIRPRNRSTVRVR